jgi:hypothetical protein
VTEAHKLPRHAAAKRIRRADSPLRQSSQGAGRPPNRHRPRLFRTKRTGLAAATALVSLNVWTGAPLLALWVGSRFEGWVGEGAGTSMRAVFVLVVVLAVLELALTLALTRLSAAYDELTGRPPAARQSSPWLRSMRGEREELARERQGISAVERLVVLSVVAAALAFEIWFFFFAGSPLPSA